MSRTITPTLDRDFTGVLEEERERRVAWFRRAGWGAFVHYLADDEQSSAEWNAQVDAFDVEGLADQLAAAQVPYCFVTLGQNSGHYCAPNAAYDCYVGIEPSKCARRDLISDLYTALSARGIELLVYLPAGAPDRDEIAMERLQWKWLEVDVRNEPPSGLDEQGRPWGSAEPGQPEFQRKWEDVIREWSLRWGAKVRGWWFDGLYFPRQMYDHPEPPNWQSLAAAVRAGNPDSILALNPGVYRDHPALTEYQDFTGGENNDNFPDCAGPWIHGLQWHVLTYLGETWGRGEAPRLSDRFMATYTQRVVAHGGVATYDVPILPSGLIPAPFLAQLTSIGTAVAGMDRR